MTDVTARLAEIKARAEAATDGPWDGPALDWVCDDTNGDGHTAYRVRGPGGYSLARDAIEEDAEFIARARTDVPWLVEQVERLSAAVEAVRVLHVPVAESSDDAGWTRVGIDCAACWEPHPCPTVRALDAHLPETKEGE